MEVNLSLAAGFFDGIKPEPRLTVSQWSDRYRYLSNTASAEPGLYRTDRTPYMREIMDHLSASSPTQEVVFMKGAQVGATEAGFNWVGYIIDIAPAATLMVMPTDKTSKRNSKMRLDPMIEATPRLRERVKPSRARDSGNTTEQKDFPGGTIIMAGANSPVGLRSVPAKNLILDEVDGYPLDLGGEGSPLDLAMARTRTFQRRKVLIISTPTIEGQSVIDREFKDSDQRRYHVPCPHCGHKQHLVFENLKWPEGRHEEAAYMCIECGALIEERFKPTMFKDKAIGGEAEWIATNPDYKNRLRVGYHINSLYSPFGWYSWADAAKDFIRAQEEGDVKLKVFYNTVLGETFKQKGDAPEWEVLYERREDYLANTPKREVVFITCGVDVQKDRLELELVGWVRGKRSYSLDYRTIEGDTASKDTWDKLALVMQERFRREDGAQLSVAMMAVDTGYNTIHAYDFCRRFDLTRVVPVKGKDAQGIMVAPPRQVDVTKAGKKIGRTKVWHIDVSMIKSELYGWLRQYRNEDGSTPPGYCHFPMRDSYYFKGLTAEHLVLNIDRRGYRKFEWQKKFDRNEPLDCRVYARAAASILGMDRHDANEVFWTKMEQASMPPVQSTPKPKKRPKRSSFWDR